MSQLGVASVQELETVVRLCGNKEQNIQILLQNIDLSAQQHHFVYNVLLILYQKMDKLRQERNAFRTELSAKRQECNEMMHLNQLLKTKLQQLTTVKETVLQHESDDIKDYQCSFDGSNQKIFQTPPFKEVYNSAKFSENKQNLIDQFRSVSAFECSGLGRQAQNLMKKYNLTPEEFRQVITGYAEEQRKRGQKLLLDSKKNLSVDSQKKLLVDSQKKLLVDSQKKLYLDNTRIIKMEDQKQNVGKKTAFQKIKIGFMK